MLANVITLAVDVENDDTTVNQDYRRFNEEPNRTLYIGANHAFDSRDQMVVTRSFPTKSGNYKGTAKSSLKFTLDETVSAADGVASLTAPAIAEVSFSLPVGTTASKIKLIRQRIIAMLDNDATMDAINLQLEI